ncbi:MAG: hypothetical protein IPJ43_21930 [Saprospiraceae bacterium]|nr:hypothetical protein [Saprospiraceae bacterium]
MDCIGDSFIAKDAFTYHAKSYLSSNNVFYWLESDPSAFNYIVGYTNDFGQSLFKFKLKNGEQLLFIDSVIVWPLSNSLENKIKTFNIFTNKEIFYRSLDGMDFPSE